MQFAFRVDGSSTIGHGHLQRCLSLAAAVREAGGRSVFVARASDVDVAARVRTAGFEARVLPRGAATPPAGADEPAHAAWAGAPWAQDADETIAALAGTHVDWLVVDHYALDARWHRAARHALGAKLAAIDDLADRALAVDVLVDHNLADDHRVKYRHAVPDSCTLLCGPRHALLGPAYAAATPYSFHDEVRSIGIFMGGADTGDASRLAVRACRERAGFRGRIEVVTTSSNPRHAELAAFVRGWPDTTLSTDLADLAAFYARHDLHLGAGGGAAWERCCIGAPSLLLVTAENQQAVVPALVRLGAVAALEPGKPLDASTVAAAVARLLADAPARQRLAERSRTLVDGLGARRVALALMAPTLQVRAAQAGDAATMLRWRNDPAIRNVSRDPAAIDAQAHAAWLARTLADPQRCLLIGRIGSVEVGVIRFDDLDRAESEVSLYLDPALAGLGLGRALLQAGERHVQAHRPAARTLVATVLDANAASQRLFAAGGYLPSGTTWRKAIAAPTLETNEP